MSLQNHMLFFYSVFIQYLSVLMDVHAALFQSTTVYVDKNRLEQTNNTSTPEDLITVFQGFLSHMINIWSVEVKIVLKLKWVFIVFLSGFELRQWCQKMDISYKCERVERCLVQYVIQINEVLDFVIYIYIYIYVFYIKICYTLLFFLINIRIFNTSIQQ